MNKYFFIIILIFLIRNITSCKQLQAENTIYNLQKNIRPIVVIPDNAKGIEIKAAKIFTENFKKITQESITTINESTINETINSPIIFIGKTKAAIGLNVYNKIKWDGYAFICKKNNTFIVSNQDMGLLYAVNAFFEIYTKSFYIDSNEFIANKTTKITLTDNEKICNPDFMFRGVYFPQSLDNNYNLWNATHTIEDKWAIWGHNLNKLIDIAVTENDQTIYALKNNNRNKSQYCFSSIKLFESLKSGIQKMQEKNPDATYYSIAPNDNGIICDCESCKKINQANSATNAVLLLVKKLALQFPNLYFTTLAYSTTASPPTNFILPSNTAIIISTIDYPKGIAIEQSAKNLQFSNWVSSWRNCSKNIFVWDYTVEYTNLFDFFPNLISLQKDIQYFKRLGIAGVFEHGSEEKYSLLADYKSFIISKLLWNTTVDIEKTKYTFFENAYPTNADYLAEFVTKLESNLQLSKKSLDIYGNFTMTIKKYLTISEFNKFYYDFFENEKKAEGKELDKLKKMKIALLFDKLELMRHEGFSENGYASINTKGEGVVYNETKNILQTLKDNLLETEIFIYSEINDSIDSYLKNWNERIIEKKYNSIIANKEVKILSKYDDSFIGIPEKSFTDGSIGFLDYSTNWLLFNKENMEIEIQITPSASTKTISFSFLKDASHYIFLPSKVEIFGISTSSSEKIGTINLINSNSLIKEIKDCSLNINLKNAYSSIKIISYNLHELPSWCNSSTRKPTIACDEITIY